MKTATAALVRSTARGLRQGRPGTGQPAWGTAAGQRRSSTSFLHRQHPAIDHFVTDVAQQLPHFKAHSSDVQVLTEPSQFYQTLLERIRKAKRRLFIASLYVGKEERELVHALHAALEAEPSLRLTLVVDYLRSTREHPRRPSSASLLAPLQAAFPDRADVRLFHTPELSGWPKRVVPRRFDEGWGLQHMKVYGFDDDVILSGANLSHDYFTHRQDRYIRFSHHPPLADYFDRLLQTTTSLSYVLKGKSTAPDPAFDLVWPESNACAAPTPSSSTARHFKDVARDAFSAHTATWLHRSRSPIRPPSTTPSHLPDTSLFPILQMGSFGIAHETETVVPRVLQLGNALASAPGGSEATLDWTSGYFSMLREYKTRVLDTRTLVRIVAAAPEANGFFGSAGVSKYIPPAYTHLERMFYDEVVARKKEAQIELREWKREGWTYHAKGIWLSPTRPLSLSAHIPHHAMQAPTHNPGALSHPKTGPPALTIIGSSNYGRRSAERDLEASLLLVTEGEGLRGALGEEVKGLRRWATDRVDEGVFERPERQVKWGVKLAARAIRNML